MSAQPYLIFEQFFIRNTFLEFSGLWYLELMKVRLNYTAGLLVKSYYLWRAAYAHVLRIEQVKCSKPLIARSGVRLEGGHQTCRDVTDGARAEQYQIAWIQQVPYNTWTSKLMETGKQAWPQSLLYSESTPAIVSGRLCLNLSSF